MKRINIFKNNILTNQAFFPTEEEAQAWLVKHEGMKSFGQSSYSYEEQVEISPAVYGAEGDLIQEAQFETRVIEVPGEYEIVIEDITSQVEQERTNAEAEKFLNETDWKVLRHRDQQEMGLATSLTGEEFQQLLQERQMAREAIIR